MYSRLQGYFKNEGLMLNFLLKALFVLTLAQQIYLPQKHDYFHLALLFMFMVFIDIYDENHRPMQKEMSFMVSIFGATVISIVEKWMSLNLEMFYFGFLISAALVAMKVLWDLMQILKTPEERFKVAERNHKLFKRKITFVTLILYGLEGIMGITVGYTVYLAILSLL